MTVTTPTTVSKHNQLHFIEADKESYIVRSNDTTAYIWSVAKPGMLNYNKTYDNTTFGIATPLAITEVQVHGSDFYILNKDTIIRISAYSPKLLFSTYTTGAATGFSVFNDDSSRYVGALTMAVTTNKFLFEVCWTEIDSPKEIRMYELGAYTSTSSPRLTNDFVFFTGVLAK